MVFLDAATGLRRSELFALKWDDVDFDDLQINVQRSIYMNIVGNCKTEASRKPVPMDPILASELWAWKQDSPYEQPHDCVSSQSGQKPLLAGHPSFACDPPSSPPRRDSEAHRLAHVPTQLFYHAGGERREREGGPGTHAPRELPVHT